MSCPRSNKQLSAISFASQRTVYSLARRTSGSIVDLVLKILDDEGPRPMKNLRPVQKIRNCADQFEVDHQDQYEARVQSSRDKVDLVHVHNAAFPKMYDELKKRRSLEKPVAYSSNQIKISRSGSFDPNCNACIKFKNRTELGGTRRRIRKISLQSSNCRVKSNRESKAKILKPKTSQRKYQTQSKGLIFPIKSINKGCQCSKHILPTETKGISTLDQNSLSVPEQGVIPTTVTRSYSSLRNDEVKSVIFPTHENSKRSDINSGNTESNSIATISSYNSFKSMEHEPMI